MHTRFVRAIAGAALAALVFGPGCASTPKGDAGALNVPQGFSISQDGLREVVLAWSKPTDASVRYRVERAAAQDGTFAPIGEEDPHKGNYTDRGAPGQPLNDRTDYFYHLVAVSGSGTESAPSEVLKSVTAASPVPPTDLQVVAPKSRGVKLSWTASTAPAVVKYRVERAEAAQADVYTTLVEVAATEYMDGGTAASSLKDSTLYLYRVLAINRVNAEGTPCEPVQVTTMPPPEAPKNLTAQSRQVRCVPLAWDASAEEDVIRYDVYRSNSKKGPFEKIGDVKDRNKPQYLDGKNDPGNLEDDGTYYYRIRAINAVTAESADSDIMSAETREVPPRIEGVQVQVRQPREVPITWQASPDEKVLGYEIWRAEGESDYGPVGRVGGRDVTSFVDRGGFKQVPDVSDLKDDTVYNYKIIAFNTAYARSSASDPVASQTKASPAQPDAPVTTANLPRAIDLAWKENSETDIVAYVVEASNDGADFKRLATVPAQKGQEFARAREDGLADGTSRRYRIRAIDKDRLISAWSATVTGQAKPIPDAPAHLRQEATDSGIRITWDAPTQPDVKTYKLYTKTVFSFEPYAVSEVPEFVVEWPVLTTQLKIMISAVDADSLESQRSETISISPKGNP